MALRQLLAVLPLAAAAACSGGSSGSGSGQVTDPSSVASLFDCKNPQPIDGGPELFVAEAVSCMHAGQYTTVNAFGSRTTEDNWRKAAAQFGAGLIVVGAGWTVEAEDNSDARAIAFKLKAGGLDATVE